MQFTNNFQISGHETFVLRKLWLPKVFRYVKTAIDSGITPSFSGEAPIVELGLGKNMLSSAKFWSIATGMLTKKDLHPTQLANFLFGENGADPHCSSLTTQWLIHWNLTSAPSSLTIFWFLFNQVNKPLFSRESLFESFQTFVQKYYPKKVSTNTLHRDVEIALRAYLPVVSSTSSSLSEDSIDNFFAGLELMRLFSRDSISIRREDRKTLNNWLFAYCLMKFWESHSVPLSSLNFVQISHEIGSPGKIFKLSEEDIVRRLELLEEMTKGSLIWTEQAGLKVLLRTKEALTNPDEFSQVLLAKSFGVEHE